VDLHVLAEDAFGKVSAAVKGELQVRAHALTPVFVHLNPGPWTLTPGPSALDLRSTTVDPRPWHLAWLQVVSNEYQVLGRMNAAAAVKYGEMGEVVAGLGVFMHSLRWERRAHV
jgi:hypothetical protein